ncbi:MAG: 1-acyl-sn-glycerol-3-phosphate acyltransferase [Clostridia bacterium]|nr:1-acyl-sn-glycerol-3-phosphate acyltransferase [Clostridia bacterium]
MEKGKIIYYKDELNEEFSEAQITPRAIDENYKYIHKNVIWNATAFLLQNILSVPIKYLYAKIKFRLKYVGKEKLKPYKKQGYFIYGNHTQAFADTFITSNSNYPKKNFFIVNPENVSIKGLGNTVQMLGAIPIPTNKNAMKNFLDCVEDKINRGYSITIFPEAHIWPYYTKIRPFKSVSFKYPIKMKAPVFSITNTYQSYGKNNDRVKIVSYIDGPFFPDDSLENVKAKQDNLRNQVYDKMVERSKNSNIEYVKYEKKV